VCLACSAAACGDNSQKRFQVDPGAGGATGAGSGGSGGNTRLTQTPLPLPAAQLGPGSWCESDGWCWYNPLPSGNFLHGVAGAGKTDLWMGGGSFALGPSNLLHFSGGRWSIVPSPLTFTEAIWASSSTDVWFAGDLPVTTPAAKTGALVHWDGTSMAVSNGFPADIMFSVWGSGPNDVYAGGTDFVHDLDIAAHWDGHAWTEIPQVTQPHNSGVTLVSGTGPNDVWIGGSQSTFHFDGKAWSRVPELEGAIILSLAAAAPGDLWLLARNLDGSVAVEHLDASGLTVSLPQPSIGTGSTIGETFNALAAVSSQDIWLVGGFFDQSANHGGGFVSHFDGRAWTRAPDVPTNLENVASAPGIGVFAVGSNGEMARLVSTPSLATTELRTGTDQSLFGVFGDAPTDMWAVGDLGTVVHFDGNATSTLPTPTSALLRDVWGTGPSDIWAVGDAGTVVHFDGHAFSPVSVGTTAGLRAVFTARPNDVWIGGDSGTLLHGDGTGFSPVTVPGMDPTSAIHDLHGIAADDVWLSGGSVFPSGHLGFVAHFDGHAWSPVDVLTVPGFFSQTVERIWELAANDVWATVGQLELRGGGPKVFWHFDGTAWTASIIDPTMPSMPDPFMFPNGIDASFVFGPHDRWIANFGGLLQRNTR
jgi:hypothetical protein